MPDNSGLNILPQFNNPGPQFRAGYTAQQQPTLRDNLGGGMPNYAPQPSLPGPNYPTQLSGVYGGNFRGGGSPGRSIGGWNIDANGNLAGTSNWVGTGQDVGRTIGNFFGNEAGRFMPLPGAQQLGSFIGRQAGSLVGHGIGGLLGSISKGLGNLFGNNDATQDQQPPQDQAPAAAAAPVPAYRGGLLMNNTTYNSFRGAGMPTYQQLMFPGSRIGPGGSSTFNPYDPNVPLRPDSHVQGMSGAQAVAFNEVRKRNQI